MAGALASAAALAVCESLSEIELSASEIAAAFATIRDSGPGRLRPMRTPRSAVVVDDSYNASVQSVKAAADLLAQHSGVKVLVLGDMAELGDEAAAYHRQVGQYAQQQGIDWLFSLGQHSQQASEVFAAQGQHFVERAVLVQELAQLIATAQQSVTVLVKGSRSAKMELVISELQNNVTSSSRLGGSKC